MSYYSSILPHIYIRRGESSGSARVRIRSCHLNKDVHESVAFHSAATAAYCNDDSKKFRVDTPSRLTNTYIRCWEGDSAGASLLSERIVHDIKEVLVSLAAIRDARGKVVQGLGNRSGNRAQQHRSHVKGGYHPKGDDESDRWLHADAKKGPADIVDSAKKLFDK